MSPTLGAYLKALREEKGESLREVEGGCGISNAFLSQLENDKIKEPSPNQLWKLAEYYNVDYLELMRRAGYQVPATQEKREHSVVFRGAEKLSEQDREEVRRFIAWKLRLRRERG